MCCARDRLLARFCLLVVVIAALKMTYDAGGGVPTIFFESSQRVEGPFCSVRALGVFFYVSLCNVVGFYRLKAPGAFGARARRRLSALPPRGAARSVLSDVGWMLRVKTFQVISVV